MDIIVWMAVAANLIATGASITVRRRLKRDRGDDAEFLSAAASVVRRAGHGEYIEGAHADVIANALDGQATRALIIGGHLDKELRAWMRQLRDTGINDDGVDE